MATEVPGIAGTAAQPTGSATHRSERTDAPSAAPSSAAAGAAPAAEDRSDAVSLRTPGQIEALQEKVRETPVVDAARVKATKEALAAGELTIDPQRIAEKLIEFEIKLP